MKHTSLLTATLASALLFTSCKKDSSDDAGSREGNVTYQLTTREASGRTMGEARTMNHFDWTGGTASVSEIKFEAKGRQQDRIQIQYPPCGRPR